MRRPADAVAAGAAGRHAGGFGLPQFLGPAIGALVATLMALAYQALHRESERRRLLIEELVGTRERLVRAERDTARLAERERLAREIHDTLAQGMSSIVLLLRAARRDLDARPADAERLLAEAERAAADNLAEARAFVRELAPPALAAGSLPAALRRVGDDVAARTATRVRFALSGSPRALPAAYDLALLRVAQGALGNVARHAAAADARVTLTYLDDTVVLDVYDDGRGFDGTGGFGLRAMRERAEELGGTLSVESAPGEGTAVAVTLPLPPEAP
ncbi:sensor histidine kinase [Actinomadura atramentaria]|uniref:sensor histidine kinase n=1 Tax=Actinomadura atramentaria TaxID=1990 RepID=UPI001F0A4DB3|nr:sensor histidine kinase [Actinomadura atramentaria]